MNPPAGVRGRLPPGPARRVTSCAGGTAFRDGQGWSQIQVGHVDGLDREHGPMRQDSATRWRGPGRW
jgi:hypothetical protein